MSKEWDGTYVKFDKLQIPMLAKSTKYTIVSHANMKVELEVPSDWNLNNVIVKDLTTGKTVSWEKGSVIFTAQAGHTYEIYDTVKQATEEVYSMVPLLIFAVVFAMVASMFINLFKKVQKSFGGKW